MLSNPMLDVAIGLILLYLLLSIIVTASQEYIAALLQQRGKNLVNAIEELVGSQNKAAFFKHPLIYPLFRNGIDGPGGMPKKLPTYIPRRNFALAVLDLQGRGEAQTDPILQRLPSAFALAAFFDDAGSSVGLSSRMKKIEAAAQSLADNVGNETIRKAATDALTAAAGELKTATDVVGTAVNELESLFDSTMDRAAGWYKRWTQWIGFGLGVIIALGLNADSIYIARKLAADDTLRARVVALAESYTSTEGRREWAEACVAASKATSDPATPSSSTPAEPAVAGTSVATAGAGEPSSTPAPPAAGQDQASQPIPSTPKIVDGKALACAERKFDAAMKDLAEAGYPIGWTGWSRSCVNVPSTDWQLCLPEGQPDQDWLPAIFGILFTGLALSLGASFWFDLLGKFMNIRMAGKREATASGNNSDPEKQGEKQ